MPGRPRRSVLGWSLIGLACLLGSLCLWMVIGPIVRSRQVEKAIAHFERSPSQVRAESLARLLQNHTATARQGQCILTLLHRPTVTTRPTYPVGHPIGIALEQPFHLVFHNAQWEHEVEIPGAENRRRTSGGSASIPKTLRLHEPYACQDEPGIHEFNIQYTYSLTIQRRGGLAKAGGYLRKVLSVVRLSLPLIPQPSRTYECEFEVPVKVTIVPKEEAKAIELVSSPELDRDMENSFGVRASRFVDSRRTTSGQNLYRTSKAIHYHDLPMSAAFRLTLRMSDQWGRTATLEDPKPLVVRAGASGQRFLPFWSEKPGTYRGTVVLRPDPNCAYEDPAIEAIWNGTLEFPISFTITEKPPRP